jgi:hypothetical protein
MVADEIESEAAQFNRMVLRKLQKAIAADPEIDLTSKLPTNYSIRLAERKTKGMWIDFRPWLYLDHN